MTRALRPAFFVPLLVAVAVEAHAQEELARVAVRTPECGEVWSETRLLDVLRIELQPFAELVDEGQESRVLLVLSGDCRTQVSAKIDGQPGEHVVNREDFPGAWERAVAMASARLVELWLSAPVAQVEPGGAALISPDTVGRSSAWLGAHEGAAELSHPPLGTSASVAEVVRDADLGASTPTAPPPLLRSRRQIAVGPTLLWLPIGGVSFGLDFDVALPFRGPFFFIVGAGFTHSRRAFDEGVVRLIRLEATAGAGVLWQRSRFGVEGRVLARAGWIRLSGESPPTGGEAQNAPSIGLQLDAGLVLRLGGIELVLRGGPLFVLSGLEALEGSPDAPRSYVSFRGVSVVASLALRLAL